MKIAVGSDTRTHLTDEIVDLLYQQGHQLTLHGALAPSDEQADPESESALWPDVGQHVAELVANGAAQEGILFCWTGTGVSIAANKVPGIRAALCEDAETASGARKWNNANVLCLSLRRLSEARLEEILLAWFNTKYQPNPQDDACLRQINLLEHKYMGQYPAVK
jgi:ribose 5-phosphate isomerase B